MATKDERSYELHLPTAWLDDGSVADLLAEETADTDTETSKKYDALQELLGQVPELPEV